jgi:hypothetical protein
MTDIASARLAVITANLTIYLWQKWAINASGKWEKN